MSVLPEKSHFNVDNIRVAKILVSKLLAIYYSSQSTSPFNLFPDSKPYKTAAGALDFDINMPEIVVKSIRNEQEEREET